MGLPRRLAVFVLVAVLAAALFVRLGIWQLHRRSERVALNALVRARLDRPAIDFAALPRDTSQARYRRARVSGAPDYAHEIVLASRSRQGSPGVDIVTPIRIAGYEAAVLVVRGWVYSPDGYHIDLAKWHEPDTTTYVGYVEHLAPSTPSGFGARTTFNDRVVQHLDSASLAHLFPYPIAQFYVVALQDSTRMQRDSAADRVARLDPPPLDEGPHLSYAIQWFSFAVIAIVGAAVIVVRNRDEREAELRG
jgi:surfeit locus 1 family protein